MLNFATAGHSLSQLGHVVGSAKMLRKLNTKTRDDEGAEGRSLEVGFKTETKKRKLGQKSTS